MRLSNVKTIAAALACGLVLAGGVCVSAQGAPPTAQPGAQQPKNNKHPLATMFARLVKALNLTQEQQDKIKPILKNERTQILGIRKDTQLTPDQKKDKLKELRKDTNKQIVAILTPEQRAKWKAMHKGQHGAKGAGSSAGKSGGAQS